jgi:hypothetical protein
MMGLDAQLMGLLGTEGAGTFRTGPDFLCLGPVPLPLLETCVLSV